MITIFQKSPDTLEVKENNVITSLFTLVLMLFLLFCSVGIILDSPQKTMIACSTPESICSITKYFIDERKTIETFNPVLVEDVHINQHFNRWEFREVFNVQLEFKDGHFTDFYDVGESQAKSFAETINNFIFFHKLNSLNVELKERTFNPWGLTAMGLSFMICLLVLGIQKHIILDKSSNAVISDSKMLMGLIHRNKSFPLDMIEEIHYLVLPQQSFGRKKMMCMIRLHSNEEIALHSFPFSKEEKAELLIHSICDFLNGDSQPGVINIK